MIRVDPDDLHLRELAADSALRCGTLTRAVHLRLLLHLPRVASLTGAVPFSAAAAEADRLASGLPPHALWVVPELAVKTLEFASISDATVRDISVRFHYLGSHHRGGRSHALLSPSGQPVAVGVTAKCDVDRLRELALEHYGDSAPRVLTRVFSFEGAPKNSLSHLFKLLCRAERREGTRSIVTYVNPNMGFTGTSYRASGWRLLGSEPNTTYRYLSEDYVTDRELARLIGRRKFDEQTLAHTFGDRYRRSRMSLRPLQVYGNKL